MHALIVVTHPDPNSLTHALASEVATGAREAGHSAEIADLAAEGFDPRFTARDHAVHLLRDMPPAEVLAEQTRIDRADVLVLAYPVYWWSFPALLKGWIDRVFINGWAYEEVQGSATVKKLRHLPVVLMAAGGAGERTYARHGYRDAMRTQIEHGIFDYCGARVVRSELMLPPGEGEDWRMRLDAARTIGRDLAQEDAAAQQLVEKRGSGRGAFSYAA